MSCGSVGPEVHADRWGPLSEQPIEWRCPRGPEHFMRCSWCGSIHPDDLVEQIRSGQAGRAEWADRKYGWPHKFYVDIADVRGELDWLGGRSGGLEPPTADELRAGGYTPVAELTPEERDACVRSGVDLGHYHGVKVGVRASHHAKFYTAHLADSKIDQSTKDEIARKCGLRFAFEDGRVRWWPYDYTRQS